MFEIKKNTIHSLEILHLCNLLLFQMLNFQTFYNLYDITKMLKELFRAKINDSIKNYTIKTFLNNA